MIDMAASTTRTLDDYLSLNYPFEVIAEPEGGYVVRFPDLPGCMTQVEDIEDVGAMAEDVRRLWLETAYEEGLDIPLPSYPQGYSGRFVLRVPRSLHRTLAESAEREGASLNQYAATLLAQRDAQTSVQRRLDKIEVQLKMIHDRLRYHFSGVPTTSKPAALQVIVIDPVAA